ncbi:branched-chain amino acid ABC transporter permease [Pusillimonas sp.]|uniref:branched-chain amino acid ABC transporter permease n=1 Tax=Pusillimonas sp. TaxID=3040095 RepID=UPI00299FCD47|nr:branched-chain amino acid ABC transporter permease [Pusillimonas sp.]MDX3895588.1 branched-chain amino acid ABC transporter permease [Pusillimonas sp.]
MDKLLNRSFGFGSIGACILAAIAVIPPLAHLAGEPFYITLFSRVMIFAIAAIGLNIALGFGGMVSFGHALYVGIGAYGAAVLQFHGLDSVWIQLPLVIAVGSLCALGIGLCCLRTSGVAFIMITLAFAQMFYFTIISFAEYGGDDGMSMAARSTMPGLNMEDGLVFFYLVLFCLVGGVIAIGRLVNSHYGWVLQGCRSNERRMAALGYNTLRYKLIAYLISAQYCIVAGFLLANLSRFASPSYAHWVISGELLVMVILGGLGSVFGPVLGALGFLLFEEFLSSVRLPLPDQYADILQSNPLVLIGLLIVAIALATGTDFRTWIAWRRPQRSKK